MIADYFKKNKIKGKLVLLDPGEKPFAPKAPGFLAAFNELYKDIIEYRPSTMIKSVDPIKKTVTTEFETITFDDAAIYPRVRAAKLIEDLGLQRSRTARRWRPTSTSTSTSPRVTRPATSPATAGRCLSPSRATPPTARRIMSPR